MKKSGLLLSALLVVSVAGCSSLSTKNEFREGHFKIEYFKDKHTYGTDIVSLACHRKKPVNHLNATLDGRSNQSNGIDRGAAFLMGTTASNRGFGTDADVTNSDDLMQSHQRKPRDLNARVKQYPAGIHNIIIRAQTNTVSQKGMSYAQIILNLEEGKRYQLAREVDGDNISMWIFEADTKVIVSGVVTAKIISRPNGLPVKTSIEMEEMCRSSTI